MIVVKILTPNSILLHRSVWIANLTTQDKQEAAEQVIIMVINWYH
jgi:hypothetical protein